jgi:electron transfer flavoprotein alpha/beta subunit
VPFGALEAAFSHGDVFHWGLEDLGLKEEEVGLKGSATQVWKLQPPHSKRDVEMVNGSPQTLVNHLIRKLETMSILDEEDGNESGL